MPAVILTEAAVYEIKDMLRTNEMPDGYLKIKVNGDGCTGLTYGMSTEEAPGENSEVLEYFGLKVSVGKKDASVLNGTIIDFRQLLINDGSQVDNLNTIALCGCGSSFRTAKVTGNPEDY